MTTTVPEPLIQNEMGELASNILDKGRPLRRLAVQDEYELALRKQLSLQEPSRRPGRPKEAHQGDRRGARALIHVLLVGEGWLVNRKRVRRESAIAQQTPKRSVNAALRADRTPPSRVNEIWAMDYVQPFSVPQ